MWRSIVKAIQALKDGFKFKIGAGTTSLWFFDWLGCGPICNLVDYVHISDSDKCIRNISHGGLWELNSLYTSLPSHMVDSIQFVQAPTHFNDSIGDCWVWNGA